jgi:hypothetical protein
MGFESIWTTRRCPAKNPSLPSFIQALVVQEAGKHVGFRATRWFDCADLLYAIQSHKSRQ